MRGDVPWYRTEPRDAGDGWRYVDVRDAHGDELFTTVRQLTDLTPVLAAVDRAIAAVNGEAKARELVGDLIQIAYDYRGERQALWTHSLYALERNNTEDVIARAEAWLAAHAQEEALDAPEESTDG